MTDIPNAVMQRLIDWLRADDLPEGSQCVDCGADATVDRCPFAEDMNGDDSTVYLCDRCAGERAMEV